MKTLYLLRHAKSSWDDDALDDHDRPLAPRGRRACRALGEHLARRGWGCDLVLCSTARRARDTWERVCRRLPEAPAVQHEGALYLAEPEALLARVRAADDALARLCLVGHNPGLAELAVRLAGAGDAETRRRLARKLPTGAFVELRFACARWRDVAPAAGELAHFVVPRELG